LKDVVVAKAPKQKKKRKEKNYYLNVLTGKKVRHKIVANLHFPGETRKLHKFTG
jgi:adenylylsulfate kinase-like enzyme